MTDKLAEQIEWLENSSFQVTFSLLKQTGKKWAIRLGDTYLFENSFTDAVNTAYVQASSMTQPCKTCLAITEHGDDMTNNECENCTNTRKTGKAHFSIGLVRSNQELQRTAAILEMDNPQVRN